MVQIRILKDIYLGKNVYGKFRIRHSKYGSQEKYGFANMDYFKIRIYKYGFFSQNTYYSQNMYLRVSS